MGVFIPYNKGLGTVHSVWERPFSMQMVEHVHHLYSHGCLRRCTALHFGNIKLRTTLTAWPLDFLISSSSFLQVNGKGSLWCVDPEYKPNLVQALKKQPFPSALAFYTPPASPPR